ncbi:cysteine hydrolase [Oxalobacteraceae bacterium]|nr:cysteine hydrolase [Oxalobacteraceae bacterium]
MKRQLHLLLIDPQNDFCDLPPAYLPRDPLTGLSCAPALPVPGAHADMQRVAKLIDAAGAGLSAISITLDSHHQRDIAHPGFWIAGTGEAVAPFTVISAEAVRAGRYLPRDPAALVRTLAYLDALETAQRYQLMVWPVHCEIGSWGHNVHADVRAAYNGWELSCGSVNKVVKGTNPWTEHYSAIQAEVPDPDDEATQLNAGLLALLRQSDRVYIAGEAGSHCVKATTEHIAAQLGGDLSKLVLLTDCISAVAGFEAQYAEFVQSMRALGVQTASAAQALEEIAANRG